LKAHRPFGIVTIFFLTGPPWLPDDERDWIRTMSGEAGKAEVPPLASQALTVIPFRRATSSGDIALRFQFLAAHHHEKALGFNTMVARMSALPYCVGLSDRRLVI
jgi:hypothetical protein